MGAVAPPARYLSVEIDLYRNGTIIGGGYLSGLMWPGSNNGGGLVGHRKPLSWYTAEPTDWPSGIVRWHFPALPSGAVSGQPVVPVPPVTYSALIRRAG